MDAEKHLLALNNWKRSLKKLLLAEAAFLLLLPLVITYNLLESVYQPVPIKTHIVVYSVSFLFFAIEALKYGVLYHFSHQKKGYILLALYTLLTAFGLILFACMSYGFTFLAIANLYSLERVAAKVALVVIGLATLFFTTKFATFFYRSIQLIKANWKYRRNLRKKVSNS